MSDNPALDFRYAVANTEILVPPSGMLETFGNTLVNYIVVSELMDSVGKCHVRSGRMKLLKPQIITPSAYSEMLLEGFGEEARKYVRWLAEHEDDVHILRYGYTLKRESFSEELVTRPIDAVLADEARSLHHLPVCRVGFDAWQVNDIFAAGSEDAHDLVIEPRSLDGAFPVDEEHVLPEAFELGGKLFQGAAPEMDPCGVVVGEIDVHAGLLFVVTKDGRMRKGEPGTVMRGKV